MTTVLLAILALLAATLPAQAEPISTAILLAIGIEATATALAITTAALYAAVAIGTTLISQALLQKPDDQATDTSASGADLSVKYGAAVARSAIMGPGAVGGHHVYTNVYGTTNEMMECVFVIGDGKHGKVTRLKYNGKDCTLPAGGLGPGVVYAVPEFIFAGITPAVGITYYDGRFDQAADGNLIAHSNPPGRWTTDHRGRGVAYLYVHQVYAEGDFGLTGIPQLLIETEGLVLYDPRKDSTNGGSGPHRWGQVDTYEPSANPAVQEYNYRRGVLVDGKRILGMSMTPPNLILQMYFAAANINDEPIPLAAGGTEPRYRCSIAINDDRAASNVLSSLRAATAGYSLERGGQFGPVPGVPQVPIASLAFTDDDMIVGAPATFTKYRSRSELVTATFGQFADPAQFWTPTAFPPRENLADDTALGERIAKSIDLTQVYSSSQAQRIAETERRRVLQQGQGTATLPAKWIGVQPGDWLPFNSARHGNMTVLITGVNLDTASQRVSITFERIANSVYSWTTAGELFPPDVGPPGTTGTLIMIAAGMTATGVVLPGDGGLKTPGIQFAWTPILDPTVEQIDFEVRKLGDSQVLPFTAEFPAAGSAVCSGHGIAAATTYEFRHKLYTVPERGTPWSAWANVISGSQHVVPSALTSTPIDEVTLEMFEAGLEDYVRNQLKASQAAADHVEQLIASVATEQEAANWLDKLSSKNADMQIVRQVSAVTGGYNYRGDYVATAAYQPNDMVRMPNGKLYFTTVKVQGVAPPAAPWVEQFNAAVISQEWRNFAGADGVAAQTSEEIQAQFISIDETTGDTSEALATLDSQWKAFAGPLGAVAQTSTSIEARFGIVPGDPLNPAQPFSLARMIENWSSFAGGDAAVSQSEATTLAQIGTNSAAITTNTTAIATVDGRLGATWQVTAEVTGDGRKHISGIKLYNDGTTSSFNVIASNFSISLPAIGLNEPKQVFNVGTVDDMTGQLILQGNLFADGIITAKKLYTGELITYEAQIGTAVVRSAAIQNLAVENIKIKGAAVTVPNMAGGAAVFLSTVPQVIATTTVTFTGVPGSEVIITGNFSAVLFPATYGVEVSLIINGTVVAKGGAIAGSPAGSTTAAPVSGGYRYTAPTPAAAVTITVEVHAIATGASAPQALIRDCNLVAVAYQR